MTDTQPVPQYPPLTPLEQWKVFLGDLSRPFAIYVTGAAAAASSVIIALKVTDASGGALVLGAIFAGLGGIYAAKSLETASVSKHDAQVKVEQAKAATTGTGS